jgi:sugar phosphate isomerase/epimerase
VAENVMSGISLSRRELLSRLGATALACSPLARTAAAQTAAAPRRVRWAAGWLLWRDYKPRRLSLADALQDLKAAGADGIEFTPRPGELAAAGLTLDAVGRMARDAGLSVSAHYFSAPFHDASKKAEILAQAQEKIDSLVALGARDLVIGPPAAPTGENRMEVIARIAPMLNELGRHARGQGVIVGVHPHLNTVIETPDETDAIMARCDPAFVGLALDTGHFHLAGGDVVAAVRRYGARLSYFHFKDAVRPFARPDFFPNLRDLGAGEVDFPGVMRVLRDLGYEGWINVEQDFTATTPAESCRTSMRYVRDALKPIYT